MFADKLIINSHIIDILNSGVAGVFGAVIDTGETSDKRRSQGAIDSARIISSRRVIEAVASNPIHPYWTKLKSFVPHNYGAPIATHYGEIGIPRIQPNIAANFVDGIPMDRDEIEGLRYSATEDPTDYYGLSMGYPESGNASRKPYTNWYSTTDGAITFSGVACNIPMIPILSTPALDNDWVETRVPIDLVPTVVGLAVSMLLKEGDNLTQLGVMLGNQAKQDLFEIKGGQLKVSPINLNRTVEIAQKNLV